MRYGLVALAFLLIAGSLGYTQLTGIKTGNMVLQLDTGNKTAPASAVKSLVATDTQDSAFLSLVIGRHNVDGDNRNSWVSTDAIFEISNGTSYGARSTALTVYKDGSATLAGALTFNSDRRLKTDITDLPGTTLEKVMALRPVSYRMIREVEDKRHIGLIAQDVEAVFPEMVETAGDEMGTKSVNYAGLISPVIEALQQVKEANDVALHEIETLRVQVSHLSEQRRADSDGGAMLLLVVVLSLGGIIGGIGIGLIVGRAR